MKNKSQFSLESSQQLHCRVGQFSRHPQQFCCQTAPPPFFCSQLKEKRFACHLSGQAFSWEHSVQFQSLNNTVIFTSLFHVFSTSCQLTNQNFALLSLFKCSLFRSILLLPMYEMQFQGISRECISCHSTTGLLPFCSIPPVSLYAQFSPLTDLFWSVSFCQAISFNTVSSVPACSDRSSLDLGTHKIQRTMLGWFGTDNQYVPVFQCALQSPPLIFTHSLKRAPFT